MAKTKKVNQLPQLVVKDNRLMEAKFQFSLWEMRIFERMVSLVEKGATEFRLCRIYIKDLMTFFHSRSNNDYELIRDAAKSLAYKKLHIPYVRDNKRRWAIISVFPTVTTPDLEERDGENAYIELEFHRDLRPYLLDLRERFKSYDIRNIQSLKSIYSIRLYILLKQYESLGKRRFDLDILRDILSIASDKYTHYGSFKQRVLKRPQQEIAKYCDIYFEFKEGKEGRKVTYIEFFIYSNPKNQLNPEKSVTNEPGEVVPKFVTFEKLYAKVGQYISQFELQGLLEKHGENQVNQVVDYTLGRLSEGFEINNVAGYIHHLLRDNASITEKPLARQVSNNKSREALRTEYQELVQEYQDKLDKALGVIAAAHPEQTGTLQRQALKKAKKIMPTASPSSQITLAQFIRLAKEHFPSYFEVIQQEYEPRIMALKQLID